ncbi:MAG: 50S ribosomal protein L11 methyltransferase [Balneolaceae bacterium]|nr:50S ribosomal protein L11 methyltransferase [Balneolaceae bacterium]MBO6546361.1 50S ribosomal protein L11 methyltransferase [Balneolaceae bacterium]MBO6648720.1 50S ribosomal protein L11 methyltransferase [Balneolaceae bacterium]
MDYIQLFIALKDDFHELLIAELFDMDFEGFEEEEDILIASIPANRFDDFRREEIERILLNFEGASILKEELVSPQNWNETWEQSIKPQNIGKFYVRPTWAPENKDPNSIELLIDPKMAFGTGYHATTRLILEWIPEIITEGDTVLDAGTGTGILGIATLKSGASSAFGFDIDEWSKDNAEENMELNQVLDFEVELGSTEVIPDGSAYDVILANINRNALIHLIPELLGFLKPGGKLLLSGLLEEDENIMLSQESLQGLTHIDTRQQKEWIAILFNA